MGAGGGGGGCLGFSLGYAGGSGRRGVIVIVIATGSGVIGYGGAEIRKGLKDLGFLRTVVSDADTKGENLRRGGRRVEKTLTGFCSLATRLNYAGGGGLDQIALILAAAGEAGGLARGVGGYGVEDAGVRARGEVRGFDVLSGTDESQERGVEQEGGLGSHSG